MPGRVLTQFFFPSSSGSRRSKAKSSSRSRPPSINISKNSGGNIYPWIWMNTPATCASCSCTKRHEEWKDESTARPSRSERRQRLISMSPPPPNTWSPLPPGPASPHPPSPPCIAPYPRWCDHQPARAGHQAAHHKPPHHDDTSTVDRFLRFSDHWSDVEQAPSCFIPRPHGAASRAACPRHHAPPPDDADDRVLHFSVVDSTAGRELADIGVGQYIITCAAGNILNVLSGLAPEGSGRYLGVTCRTPQGVEHGGLDLLDRAVPFGWKFKVIIED
ncbi:hypothetical protein QBC33DRAFT_520505 [Phialemonium atrogriseum]|uniref:Uncharacterized protein n=1 Tax=Phialemonium atrogriseum TaxID=1093897 RepID=A0AAJ0C8M8_9PEZI|nr:uncharacterized protein QBC33DRAFT_520505 [Phialemonium atrogriseum]KAK1772193.1 hypothetical protein QBC33DRAFT_520505 [Phialemonium atrogriseum]